MIIDLEPFDYEDLVCMAIKTSPTLLISAACEAFEQMEEDGCGGNWEEYFRSCKLSIFHSITEIIKIIRKHSKCAYAPKKFAKSKVFRTAWDIVLHEEMARLQAEADRIRDGK